LPHSHNDPGWLNSFEGYFNSYTKNILNSLVEKLPNLPEMTFVWTEISFLNLWWEQATPEQQSIFRNLVQEGRVEITTGGWVMTDEAAAHIYAMADQLIEGHQWVQENLNFTPKYSWSIDPFGHGSTMPHLLGGNGFQGAIIQRIHYNWKEVNYEA
jgi:alpha-mannosidase